MSPLILIGLGIIGLYLIYRWRKKEAPVQLTAGWNQAHYTGPEQRADMALASIREYLSTVYYWNEETQLYELVQGDTIMVPCRVYSINVTQDCVWSY